MSMQSVSMGVVFAKLATWEMGILVKVIEDDHRFHHHSLDFFLSKELKLNKTTSKFKRASYSGE